MVHTSTAHFLRHYLEMVAAMVLGMVVLGVPGASCSSGHGRLPCWEMSAAMYVPTFAALALLEAGALGDAHAAMGLQHVVMFPAMLGVMLLRRSEYTARELSRPSAFTPRQPPVTVTDCRSDAFEPLPAQRSMRPGSTSGPGYPAGGPPTPRGAAARRRV